MNDQTAQDPQQTSNSYVDDYVPPTDDTNLTDVPLDNNTTSSADVNDIENFDDTSDADENLQDSSEDDLDLEDSLKGVSDDTNNSDDLDTSDEDIEAQNIFYMLDVEDGDEDLKEKFLDQLQEVIWDDFLSNDVNLLLSQEEMGKFNTLKSKVDSAQGDSQESAKDDLVEYLESLIPDLEDIMLEKALDLKADLYVERINGLKEYFAEKPDNLAKVNEAEQLMFEDKWKSSAAVLNNIKE